MPAQQLLRFKCDGPKCLIVREWDAEKPDSIPDDLAHWDSMIRSDGSKLCFCSRSCILDWLKDGYVRLKSPKQKMAEDEEKREGARKAAYEAKFGHPEPENESAAPKPLIYKAPTELEQSESN